MLFLPELAQAIKAGKKTRTRRLKEAGDRLVREHMQTARGWRKGYVVVAKDGRVRWRVGTEYSVQTGRGKAGIARIRLTDIKEESLQLITGAGVRAEGLRFGDGIGGTWMGWNTWYSGGHAAFVNDHWITKEWKRSRDLVPPGGRSVFAALWDRLHKKRSTHWHDNPRVWVLSFRLVA